MADIFREVDEEVRKDQALAFWRRHKGVVSGLIAIVLIAAIGFHGWRYYQRQQSIDGSNAYAAALASLSEGNQEAAHAQLADIGDPGSGGYALLAGFQRANLLLEAGDRAGAIALWDEIATASRAGSAFQGMATLLSVMHQLEEGDPDALRGRLAPLTGGGQAYRATALELQAVLALRQGQRGEARNLYQQLADDLEAPRGLRARAAEMAAALQE